MQSGVRVERQKQLKLCGISVKKLAVEPTTLSLKTAHVIVVRPSFPMMTITSSMMMMSCLVNPVSAEVANQSNSGLQHSSTLGAWVCRAG